MKSEVNTINVKEKVLLREIECVEELFDSVQRKGKENLRNQNEKKEKEHPSITSDYYYG